MINLEKIKQEKCQAPLLRRPTSTPYSATFLFFSTPEGIKFTPPPLKKKGGGGGEDPNYEHQSQNCFETGGIELQEKEM